MFRNMLTMYVLTCTMLFCLEDVSVNVSLCSACMYCCFDIECVIV